MILLDRRDYEKVRAPLQEVAINHLFAHAIVCGDADGAIYVDDTQRPTSFYIINPFGMSLLFGSTGNAHFNAGLLAHVLNADGRRTRPEWLQAWPDGWHAHISQAWAAHIGTAGPVTMHTRVNFKFNPDRFRAFRATVPAGAGRVVPLGAAEFGQISGHVAPADFWRSAAEFARRATGFCMLEDGKVAASAFIALVQGNQHEIGLETVEAFRGKGYAVQCCLALIDDCLARGLEPVWACRVENTASYRLAQKLGFEPTLYLPYYCLGV